LTAPYKSERGAPGTNATRDGCDVFFCLMMDDVSAREVVMDGMVAALEVEGGGMAFEATSVSRLVKAADPVE
jgi:hypothetical protein